MTLARPPPAPDPDAEAAVGLLGTGVVVVVGERVAHDDRAVLGAERLQVVGVEGQADPVEACPVAQQIEPFGGVGDLQAHRVVLDRVVPDDRVAGAALADVDPGVGVSGGVGVLDDPAAGVEGVDAVQRVVVRGDVRGPEALERGELDGVQRVVRRAAGTARPQGRLVGHAGEQDAVGEVVADGQVLHDGARAGHGDAVGALELPVDDHPGAVEATQHDPCLRDGHALPVDAG